MPTVSSIPRSRIGAPLERLDARLRSNAHVYLVLVSLAIGVLGGLGAVAFREFIRLGQGVAWGTGAYTLEHVRSLPWWWKLAAPAAGGLVVGLIVTHFAWEAKGHGVPEVMESIALRGGRIRPRVVLAKLAASGISIASGGSVGREGPIVQIGSALGSTAGQWLKVGEHRLRTLVGCGAAAGIAGTFNAPVAGALFAVEILLGDFGVTQFSPIVISSVAATVVSRHFLGDFPAFEVPAYELASALELLAYAGLGLLAGLVALVFIRTLYGAEDLFDRLPLPQPLRTMLGGLLVGLLALRFPELLGVGYEAINEALQSRLLLATLLALAVLKIVAVSVTIGGGGSGGIFAPSLFVGAMLGGAVGTVVHAAWPGVTGGPGAYALVGMGAVVAAATHAPITAILIMFELTNDYKIILPLMISCIIATLLSTQLSRASIYTLKLLRRGVDVYGGQSASVLRHVACREVMHREPETVPPDAPAAGVLASLMHRPGGAVFVTDDTGRLLGVITMEEIRPILGDIPELGSLIVAADMMRTVGFPAFRPEEPLDLVMHRFGDYPYAAPVLDGGRLAGAVRPQDVVERYNAEVFKREMASTMSLAVSRPGGRLRPIPGVHGVSLGEIPVPPGLVGRPLRELDLRRRFGVTVLLVKRREPGGERVEEHVPTAETRLEPGDVLLVLGDEHGLQRLGSLV